MHTQINVVAEAQNTLQIDTHYKQHVFQVPQRYQQLAQS
jgi:RNase P/RNase MRP subunit p29